MMETKRSRKRAEPAAERNGAGAMQQRAQEQRETKVHNPSKGRQDGRAMLKTIGCVLDSGDFSPVRSLRSQRQMNRPVTDHGCFVSSLIVIGTHRPGLH